MNKIKLLENIAFWIFVSYTIFHVLILIQVIPFDFVWGGKVTSMDTIYILESIGFIVMLFLSVIMAMKLRWIPTIFSDQILRRILLFFAFFFLLNTFTNLLAETNEEKLQAIITLYVAIVLYKSSKQLKNT